MHRARMLSVLPQACGASNFPLGHHGEGVAVRVRLRRRHGLRCAWPTPVLRVHIRGGVDDHVRLVEAGPVLLLIGRRMHEISDTGGVAAGE